MSGDRAARDAAFFAFLLDMYPSTDLSGAVCVPDTPFYEICPFFDKDYVFMPIKEKHRQADEVPNVRVIGGPRMRKFYPWEQRTDFFSKAMLIFSVRLADKLRFWRGDKPHYAPALIKVPLVKWQTGCRRLSNHTVLKPGDGKLSTTTGALLHFKFFADFHDKAKRSVTAGQHFRGSQEYRRYLKHVSKTPNLSFMYSGSRRYVNSNSLVVEKIIKTNVDLESFVRTMARAG